MKNFRLTGGISGVLVGIVGLIVYFVNGFSWNVLFMWLGSSVMLGSVFFEFFIEHQSVFRGMTNTFRNNINNFLSNRK